MARPYKFIDLVYVLDKDGNLSPPTKEPDPKSIEDNNEERAVSIGPYIVPPTSARREHIESRLQGELKLGNYFNQSRKIAFIIEP